jgi:hypothetical protein
MPMSMSENAYCESISAKDNTDTQSPISELE